MSEVSTNIPCSDTGGVKPMTIAGRMVRQRERCIGMTPEERAWRAQWLKDQILTKREPVYVKELHDAFRNPIRRFYMRPLDKLILEPLIPKIGREAATYIRTIAGKAGLVLFGVYAAVYYFKYNSNDWTKKSGWRVYHSRSRVVPGDPEWPKGSDRSSFNEYATRGFEKSPI